MTLTAARLRTVLRYNPRTGVFTRLVAHCRLDLVGRIAGSVNKRGYRSITIDGTKYWAHRLAWLYVHGVWPREELDHENTDRSDNRISNLREATCTQNRWNSRVYRNNALGVKGVCRRRQHWGARIKVHGTSRWLGTFHSIAAARRAYAEAAQHYFGQFARTA